jgi:hypothetical protein
VKGALLGHRQWPPLVSVLLVFAGTEDPAELTALLARRKQALLAKAGELALARTQGEEKGYLLPSVSPLQAASFRRAEIRIAAELAWHEECEELLSSAQRPAPAAGRGVQDPPE